MSVKFNISIRMKHGFPLPTTLITEIQSHFRKGIDFCDIDCDDFSVFIYISAGCLRKDQIDLINRLEKNIALVVKSKTDDESLFDSLIEYEDNFADNVDLQ